MVTLAWWVFVGALALAGLVGALGIVMLFALVANAEEQPLDDGDDWPYGV